MWARIGAWWRRGARDAEVEREMRDHLALEAEERRLDGASERDAQDAARRAFGNVTLAREDTRAVWVARWVDRLAQDLRFATRLMRRSPVFTLVVIATLGVGIGANTAIFTVVDAVLLKALPVHAPDRLVLVDRLDPRRRQRMNVSYSLFERLRREKAAFAGVTAVRDGVSQVDMTLPALPAHREPVTLHLVSGEYFDVLGVSAVLGRTFTREDDRGEAAEGAAVLSHAFWLRRFGGDLGVLGARLLLEGQPVTVVGVAPRGFFGEAVGRAPEVWVPLTMQPRFEGGRSLLDDPRVGWLRVLARLQPGVAPDGARAALTLMIERMGAEDPSPSGPARYVGTLGVVDGRQGLSAFREQFSRPLRVLSGVVGIVLLVVCTNVSGLLLARARARQREIAVRLAIGAGRARIVRQLLTESVMLATLGALLGVLLAWIGGHLLIRLVSTDPLPIAIDIAPNGRTMAFTASAATLTVLLFGLAPALAGSRVGADVSPARTTARSRPTWSRLLVVAQVALSMLLLVGAALFAVTLRNLRTQDLGFEAASLLQVWLDPGASGYTREEQPALLRRLAERVSGVPGVQVVTPAQTAFGSGGSHTCCIAIPGRAFGPDEDREIQTMSIAANYFRTMRLPLKAGRAFTDAEVTTDPGAPPRLAIVNEAFARRYFAGRQAVGERFGWGDPPKVSYDIMIVGVARDANYGQLRDAVRPLIYLPQIGGRLLIVRGHGAPERLAASLRSAITSVDPRLVVLGLRLVTDDVERALVRERLLARLSMVFGLTAAALTALGIYGLMAYRVETRRRELGIRFALGARPAGVLVAELGSALGLAVLGSAVGGLAAPAVGTLVSSQFFGVSPTDPRLLVTAFSLLVTVTTAAALVPALRAARVDPTVALRSE